MDYLRIGTIRRSPLSVLANKAADALMCIERPSRFAVTIEPEGVVMVEPMNDAVPDEIVGVYNPVTLEGEGCLMRFRLSNQIREDLRSFVQQAQK